MLKEEFEYSSQHNTKWLSKEDLRNLLQNQIEC